MSPCSLGILTADQAAELARARRGTVYNHKPGDPPGRTSGTWLTTHGWRTGYADLRAGSPRPGWKLCLRRDHWHGRDGGSSRAELAGETRLAGAGRGAAQFPETPAPGTPLGGPSPGRWPPRRCGPSRPSGWPCRAPCCGTPAGVKLTLGDLGTEAGCWAASMPIIVGNYLTTLGRPAHQDLDMLNRLHMPIKALSATL